MARKQSANAKEFHREHPQCWMCRFLGHRQMTPTELHHLVGRGRGHDVRPNYVALCQRCHATLQSRTAACNMCLVLKRKYDPDHYDPALMCDLRGWAHTWITPYDVDQCEQIMSMMREVT